MAWISKKKFFNLILPFILSVTMVTAAFVVWQIETAPKAHASSFGYNTVGTHAQMAVDKYGTYAVAPSSGTVTDIYAYLNNTGTSGTVDVGIYSGTLTTFTAAVAHSSTQTVSSVTAAWYDFPVSASITSGQGYWIMLEAQSGSGVRYYYDTSPTGAGYTMAYGCTSPAFGTWTTPVGGCSYFTSDAASIYIVYTPSGGGTQTPNTNMTIFNGVNAAILKGANMVIFKRN